MVSLAPFYYCLINGDFVITIIRRSHLNSNFLFIIGPCALESISQVDPIVAVSEKYGITHFRAQLFKPRTNPHSFQGLGTSDAGMKIINHLRQFNLKLVCEGGSIEQIEYLLPFVDVLQIGARNMQNFELLKKVGTLGGYKKRKNEIEILLKRGFANTYQEWMSSAKYLEESGVLAEKIILCERGSRNISSPNGVVLDLPLAYKAKLETSYRVIVDPSHGTKDSKMILPMLRGICAIGFDGAMIEVHPIPKDSLSDAGQAITPDQLEEFFLNM